MLPLAFVNTVKEADDMAKTKETEKKVEETMEELIASNISSLTASMTKTSETIDLLTRKVTSMACHIIALESLLSEVVAITGVDLARVNQKIRGTVAADPTARADADIVIDLAASIASQKRL